MKKDSDYYNVKLIYTERKYALACIYNHKIKELYYSLLIKYYNHKLDKLF